MLDNMRTTELVERLLLDATAHSPEVLEALTRLDQILDHTFELSCFLQKGPTQLDRDEAYQDFAETMIDSYLRG